MRPRDPVPIGCDAAALRIGGRGRQGGAAQHSEENPGDTPVQVIVTELKY
jgi:hypothetical protein